ncbi:hypothetical protein LUZ60_004686 [Juncus effusus]|nr:hypothetical protein LUZ60_004686 [Juncus effusus]
MEKWRAFLYFRMTIHGGNDLGHSHATRKHNFCKIIIIQGRSKFIRSWAWKKFMSGCVILFPIAITFYTTWWFISFFDGFFSPIYAHLEIRVFGIGFVTSIIFIFLVGVFTSSWLGASLLGLGEWFIKKTPLVSSLYSASKQISAAISPDQNSRAFKEVAILCHPRVGEYALGFITSTIILRTRNGEIKLSSFLFFLFFFSM